jgi:hypothetical protein
MIVLYSLLLLLLGVVKFLIDRRAASLERKHARLAKETHTLLHGSNPREGNSGKPDPYLNARRQYLLGALIQKKERLEARCLSWRGFAEKYARWVKGVRGWKGKVLPYTFGVIDVGCLLHLMDYYGAGQYTSLPVLVEHVRTLLSR